MKETNFLKSNECIVERAYESVYKTELSQEDFQKLIQDKFERAKRYHEALTKDSMFGANQ